MNKRQEIFSGYWEECLNGVIYAVACKKAPLGLLSAAAVAEIVDREVWERRFGCSRVQHGAFLWLRSLEEENPQLGGDVRQRIRDFRPKAGLTPGAGWPAAVGAGRCGSRASPQSRRSWAWGPVAGHCCGART